MLVRDVMTRRAETIGPDDNLQNAARRMKDRGIGSLVVCEGERVVGVVTDRDLVVRGVANGADPREVSVRSTMTPHVLECWEAEELERAVQRMERGAVRRLVVLDEAGRLTGVLTADDVALRSPSLAGDIIEHAVVPGLPQGPWPWWDEAVP